jgi:HlyD family secretion protein
MFTRIFLPIIAVIVLGLSTISILSTQPAQAAADPPMAPQSSTNKPRVAASGLIEANSENISVGSHLSGIATEVTVKIGDLVKAGAPLFHLDTRHLEAQLIQAKAQFASREADARSAEARVLMAKSTAHEAHLNLANAESIGARRGLSAEELTRRRTAVESANAEVVAADATVASAKAEAAAADAAVGVIATDLARSTVTAPIDGTVLQIKLRPGEAVTAGPVPQAYILLGNLSPLHLRVDVDEHEAWRVKATAGGEAQVRGNAALRTGLTFVRFEPYIIPKVSLTGAATERVDTRVLQIIYRLETANHQLFPGQQMDVFIDAGS